MKKEYTKTGKKMAISNYAIRAILIIVTFISFVNLTFAQEKKVPIRETVFEAAQIDSIAFDKVKVDVGGDFAIQYQTLDHHANGANLIPLGSNFNLPTANMNIGAFLEKGVYVKLETYLSARHHNETWVKGGYLLLDQMPFIKSDAIENIMKYMTLKVGVMELDFGDAHYRRPDNGNTVRNPFVGNYIMDAFTTAPGLELTFRNNGLIAMGGVTTGTLKPALTSYSAASKKYTAYNGESILAFYGKIGYDKQVNEDLRLRGTASIYNCGKHYGGTLYNGDRAGSRYYFVMNRETFSPDDVDVTKNHTSGRWSPGSHNAINAIMFNLFAKYKGLELFGTYEIANGTNPSKTKFNFGQYAVEGIYRFGGHEQFFGGARYNSVINSVKKYNANSTVDDPSVDRLQFALGWFFTKNIIMKVEYMQQKYNKFPIYGTDAGFDGVIVEAAISF